MKKKMYDYHYSKGQKMEAYVHLFEPFNKDSVTGMKFPVTNKECSICRKDVCIEKTVKMLILRQCYHVFDAECLLEVSDLF